MMTKTIENNADELKTKIGGINDDMKTLLEGPVAVGGGEVIPLEISPPEDVEDEPEVETDDEEEPEVETDDEEEPEVETYDEEEPEVETDDEEEPVVESDDEEEPEVMVEGMDDKSDEEEPELQFGNIRIADSDDEF